MTEQPQLTAPTAQIPRDRWGRPLVVPPEGGERMAYTRCTTFVSAIEDTYNLSRWQMRMVATGIVDRQDLQLAVAAHREDKEHLNAICEQAIEAAKGNAAATTGTALHAITETHDRGLDVGRLPDTAARDLEAYVQATAQLKAVAIEQFMVQDQLRIGGTPDRVVMYPQARYIADLKTGSIEYGFLKIAAQLAVYARSVPYDVTTDRRLEPHGADLDRGIVIHLPAGSASCRLYWVDLQAGWQAVQLARELRASRGMKFRDLYTPLNPGPAPLPALEPAPATPAPSIDAQIAAAESAEQIRALWRSHSAEWTDALTQLAKERIADLASTNPPEGVTA